MSGIVSLYSWNSVTIRFVVDNSRAVLYQSGYLTIKGYDSEFQLYTLAYLNHHDLGPLGGIANEAGIRRQIRILKDMGCNAIRT